jgi:homoaconitase/3-isopropylmalate dehydratase large subunit
VKAGQYVIAKIDQFMAGDGATTLYRGFKEIGIGRAWDPDRIVVLCNHYVPARDIDSAEDDVVKCQFVKEFGITHWYEVGRSCICHQLFPEKGFALPGTLIVGMDSHSTSYGAFNAASTSIQAPETYYLAAKGEIGSGSPKPFGLRSQGNSHHVLWEKTSF